MIIGVDKAMSPKEFAEYMKRHSQTEWGFGAKGIDVETSHRRMDSLMCKVLTDLGYGEGVKVFKNAPKYYA